MRESCQQCPMHRFKPLVRVPAKRPTGDWNGLAIVAEQPAWNEAREGEPLVGRSGVLLNRVLQSNGIVRDHCYITNAFICYHDSSALFNEVEKARCALACRQRLVKEMQDVSPEYILALGGVSIKSLTGNFSTSTKRRSKPDGSEGELLDDDDLEYQPTTDAGWVASVEALRGAVLRSSLGDLIAPDIPGTVLAAKHPAAILRGYGQDYDILDADVGKLARWMEQGGPRPWVDASRLAPRPQELRQYLEWVCTTYGGFTCDIECVPGVGETRFNRWMDVIRLIGVGHSDMAMGIPMLAGEWESFYSPGEFLEVVGILKEYLSDGRYWKLFHNFPYDVPVLERHGMPVVGVIHDTMAAHYTLYHVGVSHGLGSVAQQYFDIPPWKSLHGKNHIESTIEDECLYNSRDVRSTSMVWDVTRYQVVQEGLWKTYVMTVRNMEFAWKMGQVGIPVHHESHVKSLDEWAEKRAVDRDKLYSVAGIGEVQLSLMRSVAKLPIRALRESKVTSYPSDITVADCVALLSTIREAYPRITNKRNLRDLYHSDMAIQGMLSDSTPHGMMSQVVDDLGILSNAIRSVREAKKAREHVPQDVLDALPKDAVIELGASLSVRVQAAVEKHSEALRLLQVKEKQTKADRGRIEKLLAEVEQSNRLPVLVPDDLLKVLEKEWTAVTRGRRQLVSLLARVVRTASRRLDRFTRAVPLVNFNSDYETGLVVHHWFGLPVQAPLTSKGEYAVDKSALDHVKGHPVVKAYQTAKLSHDRWDWLRTLPVYPDGRVHPYFKPFLLSGRWSSGDAGPEAHPLESLNAQNFEECMMHVFGARDGCVFVGADFSGLELRVGGVMTGCRTLIQQFERYDSGMDLKVHAQTARLLWPEWKNLPMDEQKERYQEGRRYHVAKTMGFLIFYGGGPEALAAKVIAEEEYEPDPQVRAKRDAEIREESNAAYQRIQTELWPEVFIVREQWHRDAMETGRLRIGWLTGRFLRFPLRDDEHVSPTLCANAPVQCTAGEIAHYALEKLFRSLPTSARVVEYIHDCIIVECPEWMATRVRDLMKDCMEMWIEGPGGGLMCRVDPKIGRTFAEVH